jgi:hypothetical protein
MVFAAGACGVLLSFGPNLPGYAFLHEHLPPLQAIRAVVRFGYLGIFAVAVLAGFGLSDLRRRWATRAWLPAATGLIVVLAALEPLAAPLFFRASDPVPAIYALPGSDPRAVVAELPLPSPRAVFANGAYMLNSTRHWRPMLNGYSGFVPGSYREHAAQLAAFPDAAAIEALRQAGVTHVFVHRNRLAPEAAAAVQHTAALQHLASEDAIDLYRVAAR